MDNNNNINSVQPQPAPAPAPAPGPAQQPVYQQPVQYQQVPPVYQMPPYQMDPSVQSPVPTEEEKAKRKKANLLCFISIGLMVIPELLYSVIGGLSNSFDKISDNYETFGVITQILVGGMGASYIASWVLMLIARIKYKTTFSKVLMWIYIGILAVSVIGILLLVAMCAYILKDCHGF